MKTRHLLLFTLAAGFFLGAAYLDLALRGRSAFLEGERYMALALGGKAADLPGGKRENPAKYAYIWYRTAAEDFSPPETRWTRLARKKAPEALALWAPDTNLEAGRWQGR
ncbi:MAG TPA: hypothetical protein PL037_02130 [Elusimicrobiales bacterium]|nr:hypothetical protein [Elusimicrobiales bacterium]